MFIWEVNAMVSCICLLAFRPSRFYLWAMPLPLPNSKVSDLYLGGSEVSRFASFVIAFYCSCLTHIQAYSKQFHGQIQIAAMRFLSIPNHDNHDWLKKVLRCSSYNNGSLGTPDHSKLFPVTDTCDRIGLFENVVAQNMIDSLFEGCHLIPPVLDRPK